MDKISKNKLSIVSTLYCSAPNIAEFVERVSREAKRITKDYEIILVNDGSPDDSLDKVLDLQKEHDGIIVIDLSRNFGHHKAMMTGLEQANGDRIFLIDSDLEEAPEVLYDWWGCLNKDSSLDVVYGVQTSRKGGWFERVSGEIFYRLFNFLSPVKMPRNVTVARLMSSRYVNALVKHRDKELYLFGLLSFVGFKQEGVEVVKRCKESTTYTFFRKCALFVNALTSFSNYPLYVIFYVGIIITIFAIFYIVYTMFQGIFVGRVVPGWITLAVSIWAVGGAILTAVGVVGIYLAKIFSEVKPRPNTIIKEIYRKNGE